MLQISSFYSRIQPSLVLLAEDTLIKLDLKSGLKRKEMSLHVLIYL